MLNQPIRPRRLRRSSSIRDLVCETKLTSSDLIMPLFVKEGISDKEPIYTMPGIYRHTISSAIEQCKIMQDLGIKACALFPNILPEKKDSNATEAKNLNNFYNEAIQSIKQQFPELLIIADVALDPYSSDGHDGLVRNNKIDNDATVEILCNMALNQAKAGADIIAPSDMMDGRVGAIRQTLEDALFTDTLIMSYTAKYASAFYQPFRDALNSAPKKGDKKTYQMSPPNRKEALKEAMLDEAEGADILMVKPASLYTDIIRDLADSTSLPIAAYHVSGEYSMLKAGAEKNVITYEDALIETLVSIKRAGASMILSYGAMDACMILGAKK
jgi:porphobilinogen synthase